MSDIELDQSIELLMGDPRLMELCELQRTGDEVLDVIALSENQHSDILAWLFDPREGHAQGDEILRDLLISASMAARRSSSLDGRSSTAKFFREWSPTRIRTTSFGAAFSARELGMRRSERADLFVVDPQNEFVLLIENKAGSSHSEEQLETYRRSVSEALKANPRLREYEQAYIALDWYFDSEDPTPRPSCAYWLHLGYDWLETSARRALMHVERGNAAARLVVSYCNRQTEWESPLNERSLTLASELHHAYPDAIAHLVNGSRGRVEREWLESKAEDRSHLLFSLQNKGALALLRETRGMASVGATVANRIAALPKSSIEYARAKLNICPRGWETLGRDALWPVYINVRYSDASKSRYSIALCWSGKATSTSSEAERCRERLAQIDRRFAKHADSQWRRVVMAKGLDLQELLKRLVELEGQVSAAADT